MAAKIGESDSTLVIACEGLKTELDWLASRIQDCPEIIYMEQGLHDHPEQMRAQLNELIRKIEEERPNLQTIIMGYGLCGKGLVNVSASRVRLIVPRVHDCVPLYVGVTQGQLGMTEENSGYLWLSAGMVEYGRLPQHIVRDRYKIYMEKFGEKRARRMIEAENSIYANYKGVKYVRWPEMKEDYADLARATARELGLVYSEVAGDTSFLGDLLAGNYADATRFLILEPGQTLGMAMDGEIISQNMQEAV